MDAIVTQQAEKVARELVNYFAKATAQNPDATQDQNLDTAMNMWLADSVQMAKLAENERFCDFVFEVCA